MSNKKNKGSKNVKQSPGSVLRDARNVSDFSVQYIASKLRLSSDVVEALENDELDKLPAPIFVRGYIRSYAAITGAPGEQIVISYNEIIGEQSEVSLSTVRLGDASEETSAQWKRFIPAAIIAMIALLIVIVWLSLDVKPALDADEVSAAKVEMNDQVQQVEDDGSLALPIEQKKPEIAEDSNPVMVLNENKEPEVTTEVAQVKETVKPKQKTVKPALDQLVFEFSENSWSDVSDSNGKRLIFRMVKANEKITVSGKAPFKITLGNAESVTLTRNEVIVNLLPYIRGKVAKFSLGK